MNIRLHKNLCAAVPILACAVTMGSASGCATVPLEVRREVSDEPRVADTARADRLIIRDAQLRVVVGSVAEAHQSAEQIAVKAGGFVEASRAEEKQSSLVLRVPAPKLGEALDLLGKLEEEELRSTRTQDVTFFSFWHIFAFEKARDGGVL